MPVVVDATESMGIRDGAGDTDRLAEAVKLARELKKNAPATADLKLAFYLYGGGLKEFDPDQGTVTPSGDFTSINQMLEKSLERQQEGGCPGVLLLTDGAHNTAEAAERAGDLLARRGVPVYAVGFGQEKAKDIGIAAIVGEDVVFLDEKSQAYVILNVMGCAGKMVHLRLTLGDREVYSIDKVLEKDGEVSLPVDYIPKEKGRFPLKAEITPLDGEVTRENNVFIKNLRVIDEKIRILLIAGQPSWEYRYLAGAFERDKRVDLKIFLDSADRRARGAGNARLFIPAPPAKRDLLNQNFDLVIMTRIHPVRDLPEGFPAALAEWVENDGGGLVVLSDPEFIPVTMRGTPYEKLLPVEIGPTPARGYKEELLVPLLTPYPLDLTEDGRSNPLVTFSGDREENRKTWTELSPPYWFYRPGKIKASAISLVTAGRRGEAARTPVILNHTYGKGPVIFLGLDSTWRWRREFGDRYFRDFWGKVVQFTGLPHLLNESSRSSLTVASENVEAGEVVGVRARLSNPDLRPYVSQDPVELQVTENGVSKILPLAPAPDRPGFYKADYVPSAAGTVVMTLPDRFGAKPLDLRVSARRREFQAPGLNQPLLDNLCGATRGHYFEDRNVDNIFRTLLLNRPKSPINFEFSLWDSFGLLALALILFSLEWLVRKLNHLD